MKHGDESGEWRAAVDSLTETDRATTMLAIRPDMCGDLDDVRYGEGDYR